MKTLNILAKAFPLCFAFILVGCTNEDLLDDMNTLKNRVENMEATVDRLNENVKAMQVLLEQNKTIQDYTVEDGVYTLKLSDGTEIKLTEGKMGETIIPEISIDADGYWVINGVRQPVKANGSTPEFRVSEDGYWQSRVDGGEYTNVLDAEGNPVKAVADGTGTGNTFFEDVEVQDGMLVVTLTGGQKYSLPIVENLVATITRSGDDFEGDTWYVNWGQTVSTPVVVKGDNYFVTVPGGGWTATVSEPDADGNATLTVTAPAQSSAGTRASADNSADLVLQVNKGINWAIDKVSVAGSVPVNTPLERFEAGRTITINGVEINKERFPVHYHVTSDMTIEKGKLPEQGASGVYFVESGKALNIKTTWEYGFDYLIVIGNSGDRNAKMNIIGDGDMLYAKSIDGNGCYIFSNLTIDDTQGESMYINSKEGDNIVYSVGYDDCTVRLGSKALVTLWQVYQQRFDPFFVKDCTFILSADAQLAAGGDQYLNLGNFEIENNIFYSETGNTVKLLSAQNGVLDKFVMTHNTFVNAGSPDNDAYIRVSKINQHYTSTNNIFYHGADMNANKIVFFPGNYEELDGSLEGSVKRNIGYRNGGESQWVTVWYDKQPVADFENITNLVGAENTPFETFDTSNLIFTPKAEYSDCGASAN